MAIEDKTVKPCPSKEHKKSRVEILLAVLNVVGWAYRIFKIVDRAWDWVRVHGTAIWEAIKSIFDNW